MKPSEYIKHVLADSETRTDGTGWGSDITMVMYMQEALPAVEAYEKAVDALVAIAEDIQRYGSMYGAPSGTQRLPAALKALKEFT